MNEAKLKLFNYILLSTGIFAGLGFVIYASGGVGGMLDLFTLWMILPYSILLLVSYRAASRRTLITVATLSALCLLSIYWYIDSLFVHPNAQGALIFLFLPLYQLLATIVGFLVLATANLISGGK